MGKTYDSGIRTTKDRRGQIAPAPASGALPVGIGPVVAPPDRGRLIPRGNSKGGEPAAGGGAPYRVQRFERHGAAQRVQVRMGYSNAPQAAATQANGRIIQSYPKAQVWSRQNFTEGQRSAN